jgi:hypothetical protein
MVEDARNNSTAIGMAGGILMAHEPGYRWCIFGVGGRALLPPCVIGGNAKPLRMHHPHPGYSFMRG